eukprot:1583538-Lingulodinium_polyedra.AAC.1
MGERGGACGDPRAKGRVRFVSAGWMAVHTRADSRPARGARDRPRPAILRMAIGIASGLLST